MKITKDYLKRIIKEEMNKVLKEQDDSKYENYYKDYFDFSGVKKVGNKLSFCGTPLEDIYEAISFDDPENLDGPKARAEWAGGVAKDILADRRNGIKDTNEAASVMKALLEKYRGSIESYIKLVNEVARGEVVKFDFAQVDRVQVKQQARYILANMIKLLAVGKDYEDYEIDCDD